MIVEIKQVILVIVAVLLLDFIWIYLFMKKEYSDLVPKVQNSPMVVRPIPAIFAYVFIILSVIVFSLPNIRSTNKVADSLKFGGLLGLYVYGMFAMTNLALLSNWSVRTALLDTVWGFVLFSAVCLIVSHF